jgi:ABC-type multidrug transport system fused ATPase/permease subunit
MKAESLSAGQQQLFGLGRALVRRYIRERNCRSAGGILLLDEMNSKLDRETDRLAQEIVKNEFAAYTIIMVAHRLGMVMNLCDRVYVLDKGEVVEQGVPRVLADTPGSRFGELWRQNS